MGADALRAGRGEGRRSGMIDIELEVCPFCGGKAEIQGYRSFWCRCICNDCWTRTRCFVSPQSAAAEWNRRATNGTALSVPPRNCDVGTDEEQKYRFKAYCNKHYDLIEHRGCEGCPARNYIAGWGVPYCQLRWAQMPYEAKKGGGES